MKVAASFDIDEHTASKIYELFEAFGAQTNADFIRKAIALAGLAAKQRDTDGLVVIGNLTISLKD